MSKIVYILREQFPKEDYVIYGVTTKKTIAELWKKRNYCTSLESILDDLEFLNRIAKESKGNANNK